MSEHSSPGNAELDKVQIAFGVATTQTEVDPERRWQAIKLVSEFLGRLRLNAPAQGGSACGEDAIMEAAESAAVGAQIVRSYGDILIYYSGFNLSRFVRYLALSTQRPGHVDGAGSTPGNAELDKVQIAFGVATTQTEVDPERRWQAIKLVSEFLGRLRLNAPAQGAWQPIDTAPTSRAVDPDIVLLWVANGGFGPTKGCVAFGHCYRSHDGRVRGVASGYSGDWKITHWQPCPTSPLPSTECK